MNTRRRLLRLAWCVWALLPAVTFDATADELIEQFAATESAWNSQISADGKQVALGCTNRQARAICVYEMDDVGKQPLVIALPADQQLLNFSWLDSEWLVLDVHSRNIAPACASGHSTGPDGRATFALDNPRRSAWPKWGRNSPARMAK